MKSFHQIIALSISTIILISNSCKKGGKCEEAANINQSDIVVAFKDQATGKYLYSEVNPLYNKDSLKVFEQNGNSMFIASALNQIPNTSDRYWDLSFGSIYNPQTDGTAFNSEICKSFLVKYKYNETDTIKACFKANQTKCGSVFETLKVYHKGLLVASGTNIIVLPVTITKN